MATKALLVWLEARNRADELFASPPEISELDVLAEKS
jgi:hypothetical protein